MNNLKLLALLLLPVSASAVEFEAGIGFGVDSVRGAVQSAAVNHYYYKDNLYIQGKTMSNKFTALNFGFTGYGLHWIMGIGYLSYPQNDQDLVGHRQFNLGLFYDIGPYRVGWDHISNCSKLCWDNKRQDLRPNNGHDYITIKYVFY